MQFLQIGYRIFPEGTNVESFRSSLSAEEKEALSAIAKLYNKDTRQAQDFYSPKVKSFSVSTLIRPGETVPIGHFKQGGRITGIELQLTNNNTVIKLGDDLDDNLFIWISWDGEKKDAVYCPVTDFFGYAFGNPSMRSLLVGAGSHKLYCYFPMPFDKRALISLFYRGKGNSILCDAKVYYTNKKRDPAKEGKFHAAWKKDILTEKDPYHVFLDITGNAHGHYVGTILQAQGLKPGSTPFFEGDDSTSTDGVFRIHGTGSEDYFNGGWYNLKGRWDTARSMPLSGCLAYSAALARTGGYRLYLCDKIPFEKSIYQCIEHGRTARGEPAVYTSVSFYYADLKN